jgi:hypothetical protein
MVRCEKQEPCLFQASIQDEVLEFQGVLLEGTDRLSDMTAIGRIEGERR